MVTDVTFDAWHRGAPGLAHGGAISVARDDLWPLSGWGVWMELVRRVAWCGQTRIRRISVASCEIISDELPAKMLVIDRVERVVLNRGRARELDDALARLTPAQRRCIRLRFYLAFSVIEPFPLGFSLPG